MDISGLTIHHNTQKKQAIFLDSLKKGVWLYFLLLIFEGALRKWVLPGLATPLLIIRDPVAIFLIYKALVVGLFKPNGYVVSVWLVSFASFILALLVGHGSFVVAVYGLRITLFHFPLIFIIGKVLDREDIIKIGKCMLWIGIGMTLLVAAQFYSPQNAWVNRGVGGDLAGSGFSGAAGYFRVPGTFSFANGLSMFYGLLAAYLFYFWLNNQRREVPGWLLIGATVSLLAAIPLSISRTVLFEVGLTTAFVIVAAGRRPGFMGHLLLVLVVAALLLMLLANLSYFQTAVSAFNERYTTANETEGGLEGVFLDRFLGGMIGAITNTEVPFWGLGLGMGTNAGAKLLSGKEAFLISEGEWGRVLGEMGMLLGMMVILIRFLVLVDLFRSSWKEVEQNNFLPWLLLSFAAINVLQGQWAQPTALGFAVLSGGVVMASMRPHSIKATKYKAFRKK